MPPLEALTEQFEKTVAAAVSQGRLTDRDAAAILFHTAVARPRFTDAEARRFMRKIEEQISEPV
ncbi:MAG: hypothetical protein DI629_04010 [Mesorhizobium amorphae]|nr:MAG: hypothetical protein DI629_04010 [Mesorhizobium amorphae]